MGVSYAEPSVDLRSIPPKSNSGKKDRPVRSSPFEGSSSSEPSTASARKPSVDRSIPIVPDRASPVAADDSFDSSDLSRATSHSASNPTQQAHSTMALTGMLSRQFSQLTPKLTGS